MLGPGTLPYLTLLLPPSSPRIMQISLPACRATSRTALLRTLRCLWHGIPLQAATLSTRSCPARRSVRLRKLLLSRGRGRYVSVGWTHASCFQVRRKEGAHPSRRDDVHDTRTCSLRTLGRAARTRCASVKRGWRFNLQKKARDAFTDACKRIWRSSECMGADAGRKRFCLCTRRPAFVAS
jgi:hypothetical protein